MLWLPLPSSRAHNQQVRQEQTIVGERGSREGGWSAWESRAPIYVCVLQTRGVSEAYGARLVWEPRLGTVPTVVCGVRARVTHNEKRTTPLPPPPTVLFFYVKLPGWKVERKKIQKLRSGFLSIWLATPFLLLLFFLKSFSCWSCDFILFYFLYKLIFFKPFGSYILTLPSLATLEFENSPALSLSFFQFLFHCFYFLA